MTADERRSAHLLFAPELAAGRVSPGDLDRREVAEGLGHRRVPAWASRVLQDRLLRRGRLDVVVEAVERPMAVRRAVLGADAVGPPRVFVRVPRPERATHEALRAAGVPYLATATGAEPELLWQLRRDGTVLALRERLDAARLDRGIAALAADSLRAEVLEPVLDRAAHRRWATLKGRFAVAVGGPEAVRHMGFHPGPQWRGPAVWVPSYPPLHGRPAQVADAVARLEAAGAALSVHVTLTSGERLAECAARLAQLARPWEELLAAADASAST